MAGRKRKCSLGWQPDQVREEDLFAPRDDCAPGRRPIDVSEAMAHLRKGVERSEVERVSEGYLALRQAGADMSIGEVLTLAGEAMGEQALLRCRLAELRYRKRHGLPLPADRPREHNLGSLGRSALAMVALAWANRACTWCEGGSDGCVECGGTGRPAGAGRQGGKGCPACEGMGRIECGFCGGTGWSGEAVPPELVRHVGRLCRRHVREGLRDVGKALAGLGPDELHLLGSRRGELLADLLRLRAQLRKLTAAAGPHRDRIAAELAPLARKAHDWIRLLIS